VGVNTTIITPTVVQTAPNTSCDTSDPNGILSAHVGGNTTDYTFKWFQGSGTTGTAVTTLSGANGHQATNLAAGPYTVQAIHKVTGCASVRYFSVTENLMYPQVSTTTLPNTVCDPVLGSGNYTGEVAASVTYNHIPVTDFSGYTFTWYAGESATGSPLASGVGLDTLRNLQEGKYTVVVTNDSVSCNSTSFVSEVGSNKTIITPTVVQTA